MPDASGLRPVPAGGARRRDWRFIGYWAVVVTVVLAMWAGIFLHLAITYRRAVEAGEENARTLARGLEESIVRGLDTVELSLAFVRDNYAQKPDLTAISNWTRARPLTKGLIEQISLVDRNGIMLSSNLGGKPLDLSDREHIRVHFANPADFLFVSKPVIGRNSGKWSIQFTRKLYTADGRFDGVVVASVDPLYLSGFYDSIKGGRGVITLLGTDGVVRAHAPAPQSMIGKTVPDMPGLAPAAPREGTYRRLAASDQVLRQFGWRRLRDFPLVVSVGIDETEVLAAYMQDRLIGLLGGAVGTVLALLAGFLLNRTWQALQASTESLSVVENISQGLLLVDGEGRVRLASARARAVLGLPDSLLAKHPRFADIVRWQIDRGEFDADEAQHPGQMQRILAQSDITAQASIYERQRPDGTVLEVRTCVLPSGGAVRTYTDITERARTAAALEAARDAAEEASRIRSEFIAVTSHEIRTPLNGVLGAADLLMGADLSPADKHYVQVIRDSGQHLLQLINDVLDFSKLDAAQVELEQIGFDPHALVAGVLDLESGAARAKGLLLTQEIDPAVPHRLDGDPGRLRQVLLNLVSNGIKFTERGRVVVSLRRVGEADGRVQLGFAVSDTGIGIPPGMIGQLFQEFRQADSSISRRFGGTGLGLAISQRLVRLMGGQIDVQSDDQGSVFSFELGFRSAVAVAAAPAEPAPAVSRPVAAPVVGLRVLLAEDNATNRLVVSRMLERAGHRVRTANNGLEAVAAVQEDEHDLVLMDMMMPEMDGLAATRAIRGLVGPAGRLPIIGLTANVGAEDRQACLDAGMDGFATKPITAGRLAEAIEELLVGRQREGEKLLDPQRLERLDAELGAGTAREIIEMFIEDAALQMQAMEQAARQPDGGAVVLRETHALASSARNVGLVLLGDRAAAMEAALRGGATPDLVQEVAELAGLLLAGSARLRVWCATHREAAREQAA